jgi:hypothetical protein
MKLKSLLLVALLCGMFAFPALAQEPTETPVVVEDGGTVIVNEEEPTSPLTPLLAMAGSVFAVMELLKNFFLNDLTTSLDARKKATVNWGVASVLAILLMLGAAPGTDIFTLTGYPAPFPDLVARIITALFIGGGNGLLHAAYEFLRTPRGVVVAAEPRTLRS